MPARRYSSSLSLFVSLLSAISALVLTPSCNDGGVDPPRERTPRNLTWTVDTFEYPGSFQTLMRDIYAISASDVYIVGHNDQGRGKMYHFDGRGWTPVRLTAIEGGTITGAIDLSSIYGFGPQDIYAVGSLIDVNPSPPPNFLDSSLIIHFDGVLWSEVPIERSQMLFAVRGANPSSILAVTLSLCISLVEEAGHRSKTESFLDMGSALWYRFSIQS